jgi:hypothetical protein
MATLRKTVKMMNKKDSKHDSDFDIDSAVD